MAKVKFDGVVEAVHYTSHGEVEWVRAYERRGPTFSDHVLIGRDAFIQKLTSGKKFLVGERIPYKASTFETTDEIRVIKMDGKEILVSGDGQSKHDHLKGVPVI